MRALEIGFVTLYEAVDAVGHVLFGVAWQYAIRLDDPNAEKENAAHERVITIIAEGCESGAIDAAYPKVEGGVDKLDRQVWLMPHWRNYFATGTIDLDLPLLDEKWRPHKSGFTARCTREIFVRRDSLDHFIKTLAPSPDADEKKPLRQASKEEIRVEIRAVYKEEHPPPNIKKLPKFVKPRLQKRGLDASENYIAEVGNDPEFDGLRLKPGRTIASQRRQ